MTVTNTMTNTMTNTGTNTMNNTRTSSTAVADGGLAADGPNGRHDDDRPPPRRLEGRLFGAIVLAAFVLYGIGSAIVDQPLGLGLVLLNSVAVVGAGVIGFRLVRPHHAGIGLGYLLGRLVEGLFLGGGAILLVGADRVDADTIGYLLGMLALGLASAPFCRVLGRGGWLPTWLATWGVVGYLGLAAGAALELATGRELSVVLAAPGGLFELVLALYLLRRGFGSSGG